MASSRFRNARVITSACPAVIAPDSNAARVLATGPTQAPAGAPAASSGTTSSDAGSRPGSEPESEPESEPGTLVGGAAGYNDSAVRTHRCASAPDNRTFERSHAAVSFTRDPDALTRPDAPTSLTRANRRNT